MESKSARQPEGSTAFPVGVHGIVETNDCDVLARAAPNWDSSYQQLGKGPFRGRLSYAYTSRLGVGKESWAPGVMIAGTPPAGTALLAIPLRYQGLLASRGRLLNDDLAVLVNSGEEIDFRTAEPWEAFLLSIDIKRLHDCASVVLGHPLETLRLDGHLRLTNGTACRPKLER